MWSQVVIRGCGCGHKWSLGAVGVVIRDQDQSGDL